MRLLPSLLTALAVLAPATAAQAAENPGRALERAFDRPLLEDVRSRLGSGRPETLAWGGYLAGEHGLAELVPELREALGRQVVTGDDLRARCARVAMVDACVRLDADLPDALLTALDQDVVLRPALLLLVARRPAGRKHILLRWLRREHRDRREQGLFHATGHLLALDPDPAFVAFLLDHLRLEADLDVVDLEEPGFRSSTGGGTAALGFKPPRLPEGLPPLAVWRFTSLPRPGDVLAVVPGRGDGAMLHLTREICDDRLREPTTRPFPHRPDDLLVWLERAASRPGSWTRMNSRLDCYEYQRIDLLKGTFDEQIARHVQRWRDGYAVLLERLGERGLLAGDPPGLERILRVSLRDARSDRIGPLPPLHWPDDAPAVATWGPSSTR